MGRKREESMSNLSRRMLLAGAAASAALPSLGAGKVNAAAPLSGKQNPGWYRYKVGSVEVTVVTDGAGTNPLSDDYINTAAKEGITATLNANHLPPNQLTP